MSREKIYRLRPDNYQRALQHAGQLLADQFGAGRQALELAVREASKTREQEKKYHALIRDIRLQCFRASSEDAVKAVLVNQFALEMEAQGTPLANPGEMTWDWKNQCSVYVRPSTKKFRKAEASQFMEFLYAEGSELGVQWSEKALAVYDEYRETNQ